MAAAKTWNVDRQKGGSYEFALDASGNYKLNSVGFNKVKTLNLPELKKEKTITAQSSDTKLASDQTKKAFGDVQPFYYDKKGGGGDQYTSEYQMKKEGDLATDQAMTKGDTFAQARQSMTSDEAYRGKPMTTGAGPWTMRSGKADTKPISAVDKARVTAGEFINKIDDKSTVESGMQFTDPAPTKVDQQKIDRFGTGQWGPKPSKGMPTTRVPDRISSPLRPSIEKPTLTQTALKQVKSASNTLSKALGFVMSPVSSAIGMVAGAIKETPINKHDKTYFNINPAEQGGRISGNPAEDLYAGMNRVSSFGNLEKAGSKRISTREKTIAKKGYSKNNDPTGFWQKTQDMKNDQKEYRSSKNKATVKAAVKKGASIHNPNEMRSAGGGGNGGGGGGRVICTELHRAGEMSTIDWIRDTRFTFKTLTKSHVKGYLFWAVPTVEHIKKYPLYRKIWKHIAQHRANDIAWRLGEDKFDLLGRIYAGIGEPTCWLIGKFVGNKQYNELNLKNWRKA
jgi:hypothetical protein